MKKGLDIIYAYIKTIKDFEEFQNLKLLKKYSDNVIKVFKLTYLNTENQKIVMRIELNKKSKKFSYGLWENNAMHTIKYKQLLKN